MVAVNQMIRMHTDTASEVAKAETHMQCLGMCTQKAEAWPEEQKIHSAWGLGVEPVVCIVSNTNIFLYFLN